jgi:DASH complex subunit DAD3
MSSPPPPDIFAENPYLNHPNLSPIEVEVLWEYAKLAQNLKQVCGSTRSLTRFRCNNAPQLKQKTRNLTEQPDATLTARLRAVENKMGLILTLVRAIFMLRNGSRLRCFPVQSVGVGSHKRAERRESREFRCYTPLIQLFLILHILSTRAIHRTHPPPH